MENSEPDGHEASHMERDGGLSLFFKVTIKTTRLIEPPILYKQQRQTMTWQHLKRHQMGRTLSSHACCLFCLADYLRNFTTPNQGTAWT